MNEQLTLGSLFDGSGSFPFGGMLVGIKPIWASEIEPFPILVTRTRMPEVQHLGNICSMNGAEIPPVDIITFGSPCQDMSIAGKRAGLDGSRSNLFFEAIRVIKEMRCATHGKYPRYIVWENVAGAFSSNRGKDFRSVLTAICSIKETDEVSIPMPKNNKWLGSGEIVGDNYSVAWRLLNAQYWGVAQRRRRIYLVADFGGESAGKILFESESVSGYNQAFYEARKGFTLCSAGSSEKTGRVDLKCFDNHSQTCRYTGPLETANAVSATYGMGGNNCPFVVETPKTLKIRCGAEGGGKGALLQDNLSATLSTNVDQTLFAPEPCNFYPYMQAHGVCLRSDGISNTLVNGGSPGRQNAIIVPSYCASRSYRTADKELAGTLAASDYKSAPIVNKECEGRIAVRYLTPTECARLQGFPDCWCRDIEIVNPTEADIDYWSKIFIEYGKIKGLKKEKTRKQIAKWLRSPHPDAAEYMIWGNGCALPCVCFVLSGIRYSYENMG